MATFVKGNLFPFFSRESTLIIDVAVMPDLTTVNFSVPVYPYRNL
jgi:hypothetical protein